MFDPYSHYGASLTSAARSVIAIAVPANDTTDLPKVCKALRVTNNTGAFINVAFVTSVGDTVTLAFPPNSVSVESVLVTRVLKTGTDAGAIIHGYTD